VDDLLAVQVLHTGSDFLRKPQMQWPVDGASVLMLMLKLLVKASATDILEDNAEARLDFARAEELHDALMAKLDMHDKLLLVLRLGCKCTGSAGVEHLHTH
jgi:hypothetical protein